MLLNIVLLNTKRHWQNGNREEFKKNRELDKKLKEEKSVQLI